MFAQLGNHIFQGLKSPGSWDESYGKRYSKIPLINGKDVIQSTGEELVEIGLSIRYSIDFCEPATEIEALKASMKASEVLPFLSGEGVVIGTFVIKGIDVTNESFSSSGRLEAASVDLELLEAAYAEAPQSKPVALKSAKPTVQKPVPAVTGSAKSITKDISKAQSAVNSMKSTVAKVKKGVKSYKRAVREIRQLATSAQQAYSSAKTKLEATKKIIKRASQLPTSLDDALKYAENLAKIDTVMDTTVMEMNVKEMSDRADKVSTTAAPVVAFAASKEGGK
jgi:phage protein U